jgi:UDP-galactopyranose mutase
MNTFNQLWNVFTPQEAIEKFREQTSEYADIIPNNLEEQALKLVGKDIYETLIKEYTEKQWGTSCVNLPAFIIKRLPVRFTYDNNYFNDKYQGIPIGGYNVLINKLLTNIETRTGVNYFENKDYWDSISKKVLYTGAIDQFYDFKYGKLEYRSLNFEHTKLDNIENFQGNAVVNYSNANIPYTRIIEHKHFEFTKSKNTVITKEFPIEYKEGREAYYPINNELNESCFKKYKACMDLDPKFIFGGRLAEYRYYDMHQVIASSLKLVSSEFI